MGTPNFSELICLNTCHATVNEWLHVQNGLLKQQTTVSSASGELI